MDIFTVPPICARQQVWLQDIDVSQRSASPEIEQLTNLLAKLPNLGPRSARRVMLALLQKPDTLLNPIIGALTKVSENIKTCSQCGNWDTVDPCKICTESTRDRARICVVQNVSDLWALERMANYKGAYHVLGGCLSVLDGVHPENLNIVGLIERARNPHISEVILALNATTDGQTTAHYIYDRLQKDNENSNITITKLSHGMPIGGEIDYLDEGTISLAFSTRHPV